jgi:hypothetical protein
MDYIIYKKIGGEKEDEERFNYNLSCINHSLSIRHNGDMPAWSFPKICIQCINVAQGCQMLVTPGI